MVRSFKDSSMRTMVLKKKRCCIAILLLLALVTIVKIFGGSPNNNEVKHKNGEKQGPVKRKFGNGDWKQFEFLPRRLISDCQMEELKGPLQVSSESQPLDELYKTTLSYVRSGGWWYPENCTGEYNSTAIIVPFREGHEQLSVLLRELHPILKRQKLHYRIYVIEQDDEERYNSGKLRNVGFAEAMKMFPYSCVVFHDVRLIPEDDRIHYGCIKSPTHLAVAISKFNYRFPHDTSFGGVQMFEPRHFIQANGFPNLFYGLDTADDELSRRVREKGLGINRLPLYIAKYKMLDYTSSYAESKPDAMLKNLLHKTTETYWEEDGLNSLQYDVNAMIEHELYTLIKVDLLKEKEKTFAVQL